MRRSLQQREEHVQRSEVWTELRFFVFRIWKECRMAGTQRKRRISRAGETSRALDVTPMLLDFIVNVWETV